MLAQLAAFAVLLPAAATPAPLTPPELPAAAPAAAAAGDVTLAWVSDFHTQIVATWPETGDQADRITLNKLDGTVVEGYGWQVPAGEPKQLTFANWPLDQDLRLTVQPVDSAGQPVGSAGRSPAFDTDLPAHPTLTQGVPRADGTISLAWRPGTYHDDTPGDPLDLPAGPVRFIPVSSNPSFREFIDLVKTPITGTSFVVPVREMPQWAGVRTTPNEFGSAYATMAVARTDLTASIPHTAAVGRSMQVTGVSKLTDRICDPGPCGVGTHEDPARVLHLEARTGASSPWRTVATTTTATKTGKYSFRITSPGTRDYRVVAEAVAWKPGHDARSYDATSAVTTRSGAGSGSGTTGDGGGLPITGAPTAWIAAAGALLVALGAVLAMAGRRRRRPTA